MSELLAEVLRAFGALGLFAAMAWGLKLLGI